MYVDTYTVYTRGKVEVARAPAPIYAEAGECMYICVCVYMCAAPPE